MEQGGARKVTLPARTVSILSVPTLPVWKATIFPKSFAPSPRQFRCGGGPEPHSAVPFSQTLWEALQTP